MRILIVNDGLEREHLSVPRLCFEQAARLADRGHEVTLAGTSRTREESGERQLDGIHVISWTSSYPTRLRPVYGLYNHQVIPKFKQLLRDFRPEVVHLHNVHSHVSHYAVVLARQATPNVVLTAHDVMLFWGGKLAPFDAETQREDVENDRIDYRATAIATLRHQRFRYLPFRNRLVKRWINTSVKHLVAVSNRLEAALRQNGFDHLVTLSNGLAADAMSVSENPAPSFRQRYDLGDDVLLFGGRLSELKGTDQLLSAVKNLNRPAVQLVIFGEGSEAYMRVLEERVRQLGLEKRVTFTGWLSGDLLRQAYLNATICVNPSLCLETLSMFNLEAALARKPVVSTFFGGASETVQHGKTGLLVNPFRTEELTQALTRLLDAPAEARRLGEAGHDFVREHFDLDRHTDRLLDLYD